MSSTSCVKYMLCNVCKKNKATVHLTQMMEGEIKKMDMCESCAQNQGVDEPGISLVDLLVGLGPGASEAVSGMSSNQQKPSKCPTCGYTQADFKKTGRLGCSDCYVTFEDGLNQMLRSMHKGLKHSGKAPKNYRNTRELEAKAKKLEIELKKAIEEERYEDAAVIRDSIKALAETLQGVETETAATS